MFRKWVTEYFEDSPTTIPEYFGGPNISERMYKTFGSWKKAHFVILKCFNHREDMCDLAEDMIEAQEEVARLKGTVGPFGIGFADAYYYAEKLEEDVTEYLSGFIKLNKTFNMDDVLWFDIVYFFASDLDIIFNWQTIIWKDALSNVPTCQSPFWAYTEKVLKQRREMRKEIESVKY